MNKLNSALLISVLFISLFSCALRHEKQIERLSWLLGNWEIVAPQGQLYENWERKNDSIFSGNSYMIMNNDTIFYETLSIEEKKDGLYYVPSVVNQNDGKPVYFRFVKFNKGEFIFENMEHDFPQRIVYKNSHPDSLYARIEGKDSGEYRKEEFKMRRKKPGQDQKK